MPDISMCPGWDCPQKEKCHRFTATPTPDRQCYFAALPCLKNGHCDYFWETLKNGAPIDPEDNEKAVRRLAARCQRDVDRQIHNALKARNNPEEAP